MADIEIEIDGHKLSAKPDQTVIQVADAAGIYIPRFCYHKHLTRPANCRMCLVEIEKAPKALPACTTPCMPGMKVFTRSQRTLQAQRAVMEFLLLNHPLDCPICDQGGECELQDISMGYGTPWSHYEEPKRAVADQDLGPLISTEMTRCIHCTRCVRFGDEIAGLRELGALGRGEFTEIGTYIQHAIKSEISGNIIELCPVGALTSKPFRFRARPWDLQQTEAIAPHDCIGSNLHLHTRFGKIMRVVSRENTQLNQTWLSDRDRFSYAGIDHPDRLEDPMAKIDGQWQVIDWPLAFELAAEGFTKILDEQGPDRLGALASPNATLEEFYLLQKLMRGLGTSHIDHRLRCKDTSDQNEVGLYLGFSLSMEEIEHADAILLIGCQVQKEVPMLGVRVRQASLNGASVIAINVIDEPYNFDLAAKLIVSPRDLPNTIEACHAGLLGQTKMKGDIEAITQILKGKQKIAIILGGCAYHHPEASHIRYYAQELASQLRGRVCHITDGANSTGASIAGAVPHRRAGGEILNHSGLNAYEMLEKPREAYLLLNVEPDRDCANPGLALAALKHAKFVTAISTYHNKFLEQTADLILPAAAFGETSGTYVNAFGQWQHFKGSANPFKNAKPAWKILRVFANFLKLNGFEYESSEEVKHELHGLLSSNVLQTAFKKPERKKQNGHGLMRIGDIPMYSTDALVRRSKPLQAAQKMIQGALDVVRLHPKTATALGFKHGNEALVKQQQFTTKLPVEIDAKVPEGAVLIVGATEESAKLGDLFGEIEIHFYTE